MFDTQVCQQACTPSHANLSPSMTGGVICRTGTKDYGPVTLVVSPFSLDYSPVILALSRAN